MVRGELHLESIGREGTFGESHDSCVVDQSEGKRARKRDTRSGSVWSRRDTERTIATHTSIAISYERTSSAAFFVASNEAKSRIKTFVSTFPSETFSISAFVSLILTHSIVSFDSLKTEREVGETHFSIERPARMRSLG